MDNIEALERRLWSAADQLRSNSKLTSTEYYMPVLGLIFLRHAHNRFLAVKAKIEPELPKRQGVSRPLTKADFQAKAALFLRQDSQYDYLLNLPEGSDRADAIIQAMTGIEEDYPALAGVLPKDYQIFDSDLLANLLKTFNDESLRKASGDVFGHIYEYFLMKFAMQGAQDNGEFFTPVSIVQTIVNVIEPDHGLVLDPACGSGGMFVQTSHFLESTGKDTHRSVTFLGQEKTATTIKLAKMNLAVHGLEGNVVEGNSFYEDNHNAFGKADFVMANPPFNVDEVDAEKIKGDVRLPFGLPGVNKNKKVSNGNYLWISYFYSYLNKAGRAGFVMSSQASSAGNTEKEVREKIVRTGHVDAMISIRSNFFYTRTVPCELWFFDKGKPKDKADKVLMLDARSVYRKVTRKVYDFSPEQLKNLTAVVWLYRGKNDQYLSLVADYFKTLCNECAASSTSLGKFYEDYLSLMKKMNAFHKSLDKKHPGWGVFDEAFKECREAFTAYKADQESMVEKLSAYQKSHCTSPLTKNEKQLKAGNAFEPLADGLKGLSKQVDLLYKLVGRVIDTAEKEADAKDSDAYEARVINRLRKDLDEVRHDTVEQLKLAVYFHKHIMWLQIRFPSAQYRDVEGLVKLVSIKDIEKADWSLTPGRYVGVAPQEEDEDFDFEETMRDIHVELESLNEESVELAAAIKKNFEGLGI